MKKLLFITAAMLLFTTISNAQQNAPRNSNDQLANRISMDLKDRLNLTLDQQSKVKAIELSRINKLENWRNKQIAYRKAANTERLVLLKEHRDQLDRVLTADQLKKMEAIRAFKGNRTAFNRSEYKIRAHSRNTKRMAQERKFRDPNFNAENTRNRKDSMRNQSERPQRIQNFKRMNKTATDSIPLKRKNQSTNN